MEELKVTDFRVVEFEGVFRIQKKYVKKAITGILWWMKEEKIEKWIDVNHLLCKPYPNSRDISKLKSKEDAFNMIDKIISKSQVKETYHYPLDYHDMLKDHDIRRTDQGYCLCIYDSEIEEYLRFKTSNTK